MHMKRRRERHSWRPLMNIRHLLWDMLSISIFYIYIYLLNWTWMNERHLSQYAETYTLKIIEQWAFTCFSAWKTLLFFCFLAIIDRVRETENTHISYKRYIYIEDMPNSYMFLSLSVFWKRKFTSHFHLFGLAAPPVCLRKFTHLHASEYMPLYV